MISTAKVLESTSLSEFAASSEFTTSSKFTEVPAISVPVSPARTAARRRARLDWYAVGVILLILAAGAVCLYRIAWAMQP